MPKLLLPEIAGNKGVAVPVHAIGEVLSCHAGGQEFESPWLHSLNSLHPKEFQGVVRLPFFIPKKGGLEQNPGPDMGLLYGQQAGAAGSAVDLAVGYALGRRNQG